MLLVKEWYIEKQATHSTIQTWCDTSNYTMSFHYLLRKLHHANSLQKCPKNDTPKQIKLKDIYIYIYIFFFYLLQVHV